MIPIHLQPVISRPVSPAPLLLLLCLSWPAVAQTVPGVAPRTSLKRPRWSSSVSLGPALVLGPTGSAAETGLYQGGAWLEYAFDLTGGPWLRLAFNGLYLTSRESGSGPGYSYNLKLDNSATPLTLEVGYAKTFGRFVPSVFAGAGGAYVSSSELTLVVNGQSRVVSRPSRITYVVQGGLGLEYNLPKTRALPYNVVPYAEILLSTYPEQRIAGERLLFLIPTVGLKFPY